MSAAGGAERHRAFCVLCGAMIAGDRKLCTAHSAIKVDEVPPDPLEQLPTIAAELAGAARAADREMGR